MQLLQLWPDSGLFSPPSPGPCGSAGKESACKLEHLGSTPGLGRSPGERKGYQLQYILTWRIPWTVESMGSERVRHDRLSLSLPLTQGRKSPEGPLCLPTHRGDPDRPNVYPSGSQSGLPRLVAAASPGSLLDRRVLGPRPHLLIQKPWGWAEPSAV